MRARVSACAYVCVCARARARLCTWCVCVRAYVLEYVCIYVCVCTCGRMCHDVAVPTRACATFEDVILSG